VKDAALREKLTPSYRIGCKRILMSNEYYPALARPNVDVVTSGIREVRPEGVVSRDGALHPLDAIVFGTGFDVHDYVGPIRVVGRGGQTLAERWKTTAEAYLGITVSGFPNLFVLVGPNTGLGHNSIIFMIESQVRYVTECIRRMRRRGLVSAEVRGDVERRYNARIQERLAQTVWQAGGCSSWYQNADGKITTLWPGSTVEFRLRTRRFDPAAYVLASKGEPLEASVTTARRDAAE
jgi:cation diffusion facilitator CzcD-associated flavoprotein CzcO